MIISNLISNCCPVKDTTVLGPIWTSNKAFCSDSMLKDSDHMLTDMAECQDLIATLDIASKENIEIPKLSAEFVELENDFDRVVVEIKSKVPEKFAQLLWRIQDGKYEGLSYRVKMNEYCTSIRNTKEMNKYILSIEDTIKVINSSLK